MTCDYNNNKQSEKGWREGARKMCSAVDWSDVSCVLPVYSSNLVRLEDHSCVDWSHANDIHEYSIIM